MNENALQSYPFHSTRKRREKVDYPVVADYRQYLEFDRGLQCPQRLISAATCFLDFLGTRGRSVDSISKRDIDDFITEQGVYYSKYTIADLTACLRSFFRFLLAHGLVHFDWVPSVQRPRIFSGKRDPRYLKPHDVQRILSAVDQTCPAGKRNYAILVFLSLYGLRAAEVARLSLDDVAWRSMTLCVRHRKCDDAIELPLLPAAAAALVNYLRVRGDSTHREIFLLTVKPFGPLKAMSVGRIARRAIRRCAVEVAHPGSHSFRYAVAQSLFGNGRPISEIAAVLGHRDLNTTFGYLSFTVDPLREVALGDGEDLS